MSRSPTCRRCSPGSAATWQGDPPGPLVSRRPCGGAAGTRGAAAVSRPDRLQRLADRGGGHRRPAPRRSLARDQRPGAHLGRRRGNPPLAGAGRLPGLPARTASRPAAVSQLAPALPGWLLWPASPPAIVWSDYRVKFAAVSRPKFPRSGGGLRQPVPPGSSCAPRPPRCPRGPARGRARCCRRRRCRSEEHTSELQSHSDLVCRLLLEKKKKKTFYLRTSKKKKTKHLQT